MTDATFRFTADPTQLERANERGQQAFGKTAKAAGYIEKSLDQVGTKLTRQLLLFSLLTQAALGAANAINKVKTDSAASSEKLGGSRLRISQVARQIGANEQQEGNLREIARGGAVPDDDIISFVSELHDIRKRTPPDELNQYAQAYSSGVYSKEELTNKFKRRETVSLADTLIQREQLYPDVQQELATRAATKATETEADIINQGAYRGTQERLNAANRKRDEAERPGMTAFSGIAESATFGIAKLPLDASRSSLDTEQTAADFDKIRSLENALQRNTRETQNNTRSSATRLHYGGRDQDR